MHLCTNFKDGLKDRQDGLITINSKSDKDTITISFKDNGKGIPNENKDKIFEPFFSANNASKNTGVLGLYITYFLIKKLGGIIQCDSSADNGTTMTITLPLFREE